MKSQFFLNTILFLTILAFGSCSRPHKNADEMDSADAIAVKVAAVQNTDAASVVLQLV
jgi:hypothetical protein